MKKLLSLFAFVAIAMSAMAEDPRPEEITIQGTLVRVPIFCLEEVCPTCEALAIATTDKIYHIKDQDCDSHLKVTIDGVEYVFEEGDEVIVTGVLITNVDFLGEEKYRIDILSIQPVEETIHEYVDLGLPSGTLWATCNIGASSPEEYGDYFAWGETEPKENYDWFAPGDYKWGQGYKSGPIPAEMTKYNSTDNKGTLEAADDAATVNWGGAWRMPNIVEARELSEECTWSLIDNYNNTGIAGCVITGKNGNAIFLPAAGNRSGTSLQNVGETGFGFYWTSSINGMYEPQAQDFGFAFYKGNYGVGYNERCIGLPVRPVLSKKSTAVETVEHSNTANVRKVMENGQVIFIRDGVRYNVLGTQL